MLTSYKSFKDKRQNQKGMAIIEMIPIFIVVILLMNFSIGFFGVIHSGILNSIAARNYAFETFGHRANLTYFSTASAENADKKNAFDLDQQRTHTTLSEVAISSSSIKTIATSRPIDFFKFSGQEVEATGSGSDHNTKTFTVVDGKRYQDSGVNPVWIKTAYGICINFKCGD